MGRSSNRRIVQNSPKKKSLKKKENPYPPWFLRVLGPFVYSDRSPYGPEFDEDLSDLEEKRAESEEEHPTRKRRKYMDNDRESDEDEDADEDEGEYEDEDEDDSTSERSHTDSLAGRHERQDKLAMIQSEIQMENEVNQAYRSFMDASKEDRLTSMPSLHATRYIIHCRDQPRYFYNGLGPGYVEFYHLSVEDLDVGSNPPPDFDPKNMCGQIYINSSNGIQFEPFDAPDEFSGSDFLRSPDPSGPHKVRIKFFSKDYIKISIPRELAFEEQDPPADAPDVFEYVGIRRDMEKWKAERKRMHEEAVKSRPPSPRDTWFERAHPMGYYNQRRW